MGYIDFYKGISVCFLMEIDGSNYTLICRYQIRTPSPEMCKLVAYCHSARN